ncbi:preprotein translocase subunit SecG [Stackebrandtia albiflava]|uniref:Protein-export membrane protein SecG n=1 Tax=Stackebrandtia albiflava TaxID=406432 RepID=A0A562VD43_9ACTN|nr:preprotein translocase subunit SecG [Stackebrandtia albiflava]TWJ15799.1 preprotein translocase subunit SecG [Stackebrandtia albiflava]
MLQVITYVLVGALVLTSAALILLVLLHRGKGGGLSSMFGGGVTSNLSGSSVAEKNLDRITVVVGVIWLASIIGFGVVLRTLTAV